MTQPLVHDHLTQIFVKHYGREPKPAAEEALRFLEIVELYGLELISKDWRTEPARVKDKWESLVLDLRDIDRSGRTPWDSIELK